MAKPKVNKTRPELARAKNAKAKNTRYKYPSEALPHSMILTFKKYDYRDIHKVAAQAESNAQQGVVNTATTEIAETTTIVLPLPTNLVDNTTLRVNGFEKDMAMDTLANMADGGGLKVLSALTNAGGAMASSFMEGGGGISGMKQIVTDAVNAAEPNIKGAAEFAMKAITSGSQTLSARSGGILNPKDTLAFEGVNLRANSFKFDFVPMDTKESQQIKDIIDVIKQKSLPQTGNIGDIFSKVILNYPHVVDIDLVGVDTDHFLSYKTSMITNVSVQYGTGDDVPILKGGKPAVVSLTIELMELEAQTADDYGADPITITTGQTDSGGN